MTAYPHFSLLKFIFCIVVLYFSSLRVDASEQIKYEQERSKILRLKHHEIYEALQNSTVFDSSTPLGRSFIYSITSLTHRAQDATELSAADLISLKREYPEIELEYRIHIVNDKETVISKQIKKLEMYAHKAKNAGWKRIYHYAIGSIVDIELGQGMVLSALIRMLKIVDSAPIYEHVEQTMDYPLQSVYNDLSIAFYQLGQNDRAITYCQMFKDSLPKTDTYFPQVDNCQVWPLAALGRYSEALQLLSKNIHQIKQENDALGLITNYLYSAEIARRMEQYDLAEELVHNSLNLLQEHNYANTGGYAYGYLTLARIKTKTNEIAQAKKYLELSHQAIKVPSISNVINNDFMLAEARIAESEDDYEKSVVIYKKLIDLIADTQQSFRWETISDLTSKLNEKRIANQTIYSEFLSDKSRITFIAGIILLVTGIIIWLIYLNVYRRNQDTYISQQVDTNTGAYNMSAFYQRAKVVPAIYSNSYVLLIELKLHNDLSLFENLFSSFAKQIRYQLKPTESIGRFSGTLLALILEGDDTDKVHDRITKIQGTLIASDFVFRMSPMQRLNRKKTKNAVDACWQCLRNESFADKLKA
ncbi:tetratricopeptide repeat protein [Alteromonas ponticola]|uniref:Tetratricopeptide repeat protein n=1 Tax=Alteromonas ponticola TaxID=2720613 RepID=A0ABX1R380_9ALTE|nr:tetratricopeptide repeat protein [Alteromonas ponticola]NMH60903.1 tetratricopeptide repeat protein [Alteromonas ponticola]